MKKDEAAAKLMKAKDFVNMVAAYIQEDHR